MTWVAIAVGVGSAVVGAGASVAGSKKQADASKKGAATQLQMFDTLNKQQQPYIQSGYGALGKLNTLLGLGGGGAPHSAMMPNAMPNKTIMPVQQNMQTYGVPDGASDLPLKRILAMRAQHGDTEADRVLRGMV